MSASLTPWCNICGAEGPFLDPGTPREGMVCANCGASSRGRALVYVLGHLLGATAQPLASWLPQPDIRVLESSGRGGYPVFLAGKLQYVNAEYRPNEGRHRPFGPHADLQRLAYSDGSLDFVLAGDVFEHVRDDALAFREVTRVLRQGGTLVFTVPLDRSLPKTLVRVSTDGPNDVLLMPPEYHGGGGSSLAYRTYGMDLPGRLTALGLSLVCWELDLPGHGISGETVFSATKGDHATIRVRPAVLPAGANRLDYPLLPSRLWVLLKYNLRSLRQVARQAAEHLPR